MTCGSCADERHQPGPGWSCSSRCSARSSIGLGFKVLPAKVAGVDRHGRDRPRLRSAAIGALLCLLGEDPEARHHASSLWDYASVAGLDIKLGIYVDPLSVFMVLVVTGVSTLIHLYSYGYMQSDEGYHRFFSYLNFFVFSMLLLVLAGNFVLLIVGWAFVGFASYALISFWYRRDDGDPGGDEGLRDQRRRRHRPRPGRLPDLPRTRHLRLRRSLRQSAAGLPHQRVDGHRDLPAAPGRRLRQVGAAAASTPGCRTRWRARPRSPR